jgi:hypothetical protein
MKALRAVAVLGLTGLILVGCSSTPVAAPVTVTATRLATVTATLTEPPVVDTPDPVTVVQVELQTETTTATATTTKVAGTTTAVRTTVKVVEKTKTNTVTVQPPPPAGSVQNGNFLVGSQIQAGNFNCTSGDPDSVFWETNDSTGGIVANGFGLIAFVSSDAYAVTLDRCDGIWKKIS